MTFGNSLWKVLLFIALTSDPVSSFSGSFLLIPSCLIPQPNSMIKALEGLILADSIWAGVKVIVSPDLLKNCVEVEVSSRTFTFLEPLPGKFPDFL